MKIAQLTAENVKRLEAVEIRPDGSTVVIGGANGAGKSSVLDSIAYALGGERLIPEEPLRRGARKGAIEIELDDGTRVERTFSIGGASRLKVTPKDGAPVRSPQAFLDELLGRISFDPLAFARMKPKDQRAELAALVGLDTTDLDRQHEELFAQRTEVGREQRRLEGVISELPYHDNAPETPIPVSALVEELETAQSEHDEEARVARAMSRVRALATAEREKSSAARARIQHLLEQAKIEEDAAAAADANAAEHDRMVASLADEHSKIAAKLPDLDEIKARLKGAERANAMARENARRVECAAQIAQTKAEYDGFTAKLDGIAKTKIQRIADAKYPIEGLAVDEAQVLYRDLPLAQASSAEQLQVSVAIGLAANPTLRVLLIRDGSLLDARSLALVAEIADSADAQVWIERVSEGAECSIIIEDGRVRAEAELVGGSK